MKPAVLLLLVFMLTNIGLAQSPKSMLIANDTLLSKKVPSQAQVDIVKSFDEDAKVDWNKDNATPIFLSGKLMQLPRSFEPIEAAKGFLNENKALFKIRNPHAELKQHSVESDKMGYIHIKLDQYVGKVPIWGSQIGVHIDDHNMIYCISGSYHPSIEIETTPMIDSIRAIEKGIQDYAVKDSRAVQGKAKLMVFPWEGNVYLVWKVTIFGQEDPDILWEYFIDAETGELVFKYNDIHYEGPAIGMGLSQDNTYKTINTYYFGYDLYCLMDATKPMYDPPGSDFWGVIVIKDAYNDTLTDTDSLIFDMNGDNIFDESIYYPSAIDALINFGKVYDYFFNIHDRSSYNGLGFSIFANVHYGLNFANAFFNNNTWQWYFGDGNEDFGFFTYSLDWVSHEFTHAVTATSADLNYLGQSGAVNESISDVFASFNDTLNWTWGENTCFSWPYYIRNLENPHLGYPPDQFYFGCQPMVMDEYQFLPFTEEGDWGGVHINSGIPNHAAYLIASQIGRDKAAQIYYRALTYYLLSSSGFADLHWALKQSSIDIHGFGEEYNAIDFAFDSVGIDPSYNDFNLIHDDGSPEFITWFEYENCGFSSPFDFQGKAQLKKLAYYIWDDNIGGSGDFYIKVFEDSLGVPKMMPSFSVKTDLSSMGGWRIFDLSSFDLYFTDRMHAAIFYDGINQPRIGKDTISSFQSWYYSGSQWNSTSAIYFIRAQISPVEYVCGDANNDGSVNVSDVIWIANYVFIGGPGPDPLLSGEVNCDGTVNVSDAIWIANYVFIGSKDPCDFDGDGIPDC